jgi:endonuclease-3 related protein
LNNSHTLFCLLKNTKYFAKTTLQDRYWWQNSGTIDVLIGAILVQNTKWENTQISLANLSETKNLSLDKIINIDIKLLESLIKSSGFYKQKAIRLKQICKNIVEDFSTFEDFRQNVSRDWLLSQKGIGLESADCILCYCCYKDEMVVDRYTHRLLRAFGLELDEYEDIKEWLVYGIESNYDDLGYKDLYEVYAIFHGMIVEFCRINCKKNIVELKELNYKG